MSWVAAAVVGGAVIGGYVTTRAAGSAADAQRDAANQADQTQLYMYDQTRDDQAPWRQTGVDALGQIKDQSADFNKDFSMADFQADPGYQFRMDQGQQAIERSAAAKGGLNSGATLKSLDRYSQGLASDEYQNAYNRYNNNITNRFNRLSSLAGLGQTANGQVGAAGQNYANQVGSNDMASGNASAAASMASANAINSGMGTGMNTWMQYQMMNKFAPQSSSGAIPSYTPAYNAQPMGSYQSSNYGSFE